MTTCQPGTKGKAHAGAVGTGDWNQVKNCSPASVLVFDPRVHR